MKPRIFISAVSRELKTARQLVANTLHALGYEPVWQDVFETSSDDLRAMLRKKIDTCSAVLQIIGSAYGAEPPTPDETFGRVSYTQYEALYARRQKKPVYYLIAEKDLPRDIVVESIDTPRDESDAAKNDAAERRQLQVIYRQSILAAEQTFYPIKDHPETELSVRRLRDDLSKLRRGFRYWMTGITVAVVLILGGIILMQQRHTSEFERQRVERIAQQQEREKQQNERDAAEAERKRVQKIVELEQEFADRFLLQLITDKELSAEDARRRALQELPALVKLPLEEIREIIDQQIPTADSETLESPLDRARTALALGKLDEVFTAAEEQRQESRELAMLEGTAALAKFRETPKPEWNYRALTAFRRALVLADRVKEPNAWTDAAIASSSLLQSLARYSEAESLLLEARQLLEQDNDTNPHELAVVLGNLATLFRETNRLEEAESLFYRSLALDEECFGGDHPNVALRLNNLAQLLAATNRHGDAEPLLRRALAILENPHSTDSVNAAVVLNNLAQLLEETNRRAEAEPLMRRVLEIDEGNYGMHHPSVAVSLNNLACLLTKLSRHDEALPLLKRALEIDEQAYGPNHLRVARDLNNLGVLLKDTGQFRAAEAIYYRSIAIYDKSNVVEGPDVSNVLNNLAQLLLKTNRLAEVESLMRCALSIEEQSYGAGHPLVATRLNNLAQLFYAQNRLIEAEPLNGRALAIAEESYGTEHPDVAAYLTNLATLLYYTDRAAAAEPISRRALVIVQRSFGEDHPEVAIRLNQLALILGGTGRHEDAVSLMHHALKIDEKYFGPEHSRVGIRLYYLARLLLDINRTNEAQLLIRRTIEIFELFRRTTGDTHLLMSSAQSCYREVLLKNNSSEDEIPQQIGEGSTILRPIALEAEELLGPAPPVSEIINRSDRKNEADSKGTAFVLPPDQPISPYLVELANVSPDELNRAGVTAYRSGNYADSIILFDESLTLLATTPGDVATPFTVRMNRAGAFRELGEPEYAREELRSLLLLKSKVWNTNSKLSVGRAHYQLALCEWQLNNFDAAIREAENALEAYAGDDDSAIAKIQTEQLIAELKTSNPHQPVEEVNLAVELRQARARYEARLALITIPLDQVISPLLDQALPSTRSAEEAIDVLRQQYQEQGQPPIWFLPLDDPITPYLDGLLGPLSVSEPPESKPNSVSK